MFSAVLLPVLLVGLCNKIQVIGYSLNNQKLWRINETISVSSVDEKYLLC